MNERDQDYPDIFIQNALISKELVSKLEGKASDILDQQQYAMVREA